MDSAALNRLRKIAASLQRPGETQEEMCDRVGLKRSKWLGWCGGRKPNSDGYWELASALGIDVVELMARIEGKEYRPAQGQTWAELGRQAIANPQAMRELLSELNAAELNQLLQVVLRRQSELLGGEKL